MVLRPTGDDNAHVRTMQTQPVLLRVSVLGNTPRRLLLAAARMNARKGVVKVVVSDWLRGSSTRRTRLALSPGPST